MRASRRVLSTTVAGLTAVTVAVLQPAGARASEPAPQVRVNQVGYPADGPKVAFAMLPRKVAAVRFEVVTPWGVAYRGTSADDVGSWNASYQAVYRLASPHAFGLYITDALYRKYGGSRQFESFAQQQLNFALGANGWGSSFVVGAGTVFPHCMQSEIANLAGSLTGTGSREDIQLGAVTDGPSTPANFTGLGTVPGMRACSAGHFGPYNTKNAAYEDNVVAWPSVEPADDYVANSLLAFALGAGGGLSGARLG